MPGGVRSRQPWLYLGADWAASDILGPEKEAGRDRGKRREDGGGKEEEGGYERGKECKWEGRAREKELPELPEKTKRNSEEVKEKER